MASQPHHVRQSSASRVASPAITTDNVSEKTVEMDNATPENTSTYAPGRHQRQKSGSNSGVVPSYMAPTQSAKAKVRSQGATTPKQQRSPSKPQWNSSTKRGSSFSGPGYDSSSSGTISSATNQTPKNPKANRPRSGASVGHVPQPIYMDEWAVPIVGHGPTWRDDFA